MGQPRVVIIDNLPDGTSGVVEDKSLNPFWETADGHQTTELFYLNQLPPILPLKHIFQDKFDFNLKTGEMRFGHSTFPPFSEVKECYKKHGHIINKEDYGMHNTPTIDFLVLTKGQLELITENGSVVLKAGDCIVQKATVHAWINPGHETAELVYIMIGANVPEDYSPVQPNKTIPLKVEYPN